MFGTIPLCNAPSFYPGLTLQFFTFSLFFQSNLLDIHLMITNDITLSFSFIFPSLYLWSFLIISPSCVLSLHPKPLGKVVYIHHFIHYLLTEIITHSLSCSWCCYKLMIFSFIFTVLFTVVWILLSVVIILILCMA